MLTRITVLSKSRAMSCTDTERAAIISITNPDEAPILLQSGWRRILRLQFNDHDGSAGGGSGQQTMVLPSRHGFQPHHALAVASFIRDIESNTDIDHLVVHCLAGFSRSPAIATWLAEQRGWDKPISWIAYNRHVYTLLTQYAVLDLAPSPLQGDGQPTPILPDYIVRCELPA